TPTPAPGPPTPTPTPAPPGPTPTPTPTPSPSPSPSPGVCQLQVSVNPPGGAFNACKVDVALPSGNVIVTASQTFIIPCKGRVDLNAVIGPPASFIGPVAASWTGSCSGDANGGECVVSGHPLPPVLNVGTRCG